MKIILLLTTLTVISIASISCKTHKENTAETNNSTENKATKYRLIVSFASMGAGAGSPERTAFNEFIEKHQKKPVYKTVFWGREGETDYCFTLKGFSKGEQLEFIEQTKKIAGSNKLFILTENAICQHTGR